MADGCRLAARIWLPEDAEADPVPALLEYLPYRRRDGTTQRDSLTQPWMAGQGYAAVRVDIRGTGDSDGVMRDEYDGPEMDDGVAIVEWLAAQPWCTGDVGMWGISWGGINALQIASRAPPALKAIIPMGFAQDRYNGDCHYLGGCPSEGNISWGNTFFAGLSRPPDPAVVGEGWRAQWLARLDAIQHPVETWLSHQRRDAYWKPGSPCEDFAGIRCAVYAISGWQDSYSRNVLPLIEKLTCPRKALVGPWAHSWPHIASPGPAIGFLQEARRWFDHWLKRIDTGIMDEPMVRVWSGAWTQPRKWLDVAPGQWVQEKVWPSPRIDMKRLGLGAGALLPDGSGSGDVTLCSAQTTGLTAGYQCSYGHGPDLPDDQRADDALSLCFDTAPLDAPVDCLGAPVVELVVASAAPQAMIAARLCEVAPDGASLRVSYGLLNLSHRDGGAEPRPLVPGERVRIRLELCGLAHRFSAGNRIRLALSTSYWPIAWPSPDVTTLTIDREESALLLPVRPPDTQGDAALTPFDEPEGAGGEAIVQTRARALDRPQDSIVRDAATGIVEVVRERDRGAWRTVDTDVDYDATGTLSFSIAPDDPLSARQNFDLETSLGRDGWRTKTRARSSLSCTASAYHLEARLEAFDDGERVFARKWDVTIPRDHS